MLCGGTPSISIASETRLNTPLFADEEISTREALLAINRTKNKQTRYKRMKLDASGVEVRI